MTCPGERVGLLAPYYCSLTDRAGNRNGLVWRGGLAAAVWGMTSRLAVTGVGRVVGVAVVGWEGGEQARRGKPG